MKKIALNEFCNFKMLSSLTYSPEGDKLAYIQTSIDEKENEYLSNLHLYRDGKDLTLVNDGKVGSFFFEDNDHILFETVRGKDKDKEKKEEFSTFYRLDLNGGEGIKAFEFPFSASSLKKLDNGDYLLLGSIDINYPDYYLLKDDKKKKTLEKIKEDEDYEVLTESPFFANGAGYISGKRSALFYYQSKENKLERLTDKYLDVDTFRIKGEEVFFSGARYKAAAPLYEAVYKLNLQDKKVVQILKPQLQIYTLELLEDQLVLVGTRGKRYGLNENPFFYKLSDNGELTVLKETDESLGLGVLSDVEYGSTRFMKADGKYLYFLALDRTAGKLKRIDLKGEIEVVAEKDGSINDYDVCKGKLAIMGMFDQELPEIYLKTNDGYERITHANDEVLKDKYVAKPHYLNTVIDNEEIDGWVLLPEDFDENKKYPGVLDIHGGPKCAYGTVFFHEMQYWVNKGYVVFFCNPHGSDGRGNDFAALNLRWGEIDYRHIMAFVDNVLAHYPQIDERKLCCTGGSYGGYMSNWIMCHTDRFCCIATQRSISNWITMYGVSDIPPIACDETTDQNPYSDKGFEQMWQVSPLKYVRNAKTPTLFIHSDEDHRCPIEEGYQLFTALQYMGVESRMVVFHGENHELSRTGKPKHRIRRLKEITEWFDRHTGIKSE